MRIALQLGAHPRFELLQAECPGADARLPIGTAVFLSRHDDEVVFAGHVRKVGIAALERECNRIFAVSLDVRHLIEQRLRR